MEGPGYPDSIRSQKLSMVGPGEYLGGRWPRKSRVVVQRQTVGNYLCASLASRATTPTLIEGNNSLLIGTRQEVKAWCLSASWEK